MERNNKRNNTLAFCLGILLVGVLIQAAGWLKGDRLVFPNVGEILAAFVRLLGSGRVWKQIGTTLLHLAEALAASTVIGVIFGIIQGRSPFMRSLLRPLMILLRSIPMIVMTVIIMVLTKYSRVPLVATSLMLIPLISEATCEGFLRIDPVLSMALPIRTRPSFPLSQSLPSGSFHKPLILLHQTADRMKTTLTEN